LRRPRLLPATSGKLIELLRTMVPTASRFVVLRDPNNAGKQLELAELTQAAHEMGVALEAVDARAINEVEGALSAIAAMGADALITLLDGVTLTSRFPIAEWAVKHRLPEIYQIKDFVTAGGLMSYA
jgi:putative ABC transport system substrate-binding protein